MRVILANKFNFLKGGADKYFLELSEGLKNRGIITAKFCMSHERNLPDEFEKYFPSAIDYDRPGLAGQIKNAASILWNREAARKFSALVRDFRPDVIHLFNIYHQISPSILPVARRAGVPVVMHLNDYKLICPNYKLFRNGRTCADCRGGRYRMAARFGCLKGSKIKSAVAAAEMYLHHSLLDIYVKNVSLFIAPSRFMARTVQAWRPDITNIATMPYFIRHNEYQPGTGPGKDFIFIGRLSEEKGLGLLIHAWSRAAKARAAGHRLIIVGQGPQMANGKVWAGNSSAAGSIEFAGAKYGSELMDLLGRCRAMIVPSEWFEVLGIVNLEASLMQRPVIAARIGGIPEVVKDGETGWLFQPGDADDLAAKIEQLAADEGMAVRMGRAGRGFVLENFQENDHIDKIIGKYREIIQENQLS